MDTLYELKGYKTVYAYARISPDVISRQMEDQNRWYLSMLFVEPGRRGRRYGSMLLDRVCRAADQEAAALTLGVEPTPDSPMQAAALRSFYRRHGFVSMRKNVNFMIRKPGAA